MAIVKDFNTKFGIVAPYHRISQINMNQDTIEILVHAYASQEARESGASHLWAEYVRIPFSDLNFDPRDIFYPLLQEHPASHIKNGVPNLAPGVTPHQPVFTVTAPPPPVMAGADPTRVPPAP